MKGKLARCIKTQLYFYLFFFILCLGVLRKYRNIFENSQKCEIWTNKKGFISILLLTYIKIFDYDYT